MSISQTDVKQRHLGAKLVTGIVAFVVFLALMFPDFLWDWFGINLSGNVINDQINSISEIPTEQIEKIALIERFDSEPYALVWSCKKPLHWDEVRILLRKSKALPYRKIFNGAQLLRIYKLDGSFEFVSLGTSEVNEQYLGPNMNRALDLIRRDSFLVNSREEFEAK